MADKTVLEKLTVIEGDQKTADSSDVSIGKDTLFLGEYRVLEQLPVSSGEADVYKLEKLENGEKFVLKFYRIGISPKIEVIDKIAALKHSHIVGLERYGLHKSATVERFYEIQEFIPHGSLAEYVAKKRLSKDEIKHVLSIINETLFHCHTNGVVHRDLKPSNILLREVKPLMPVLTDFGIASVLGADISRRLTSRSRTVDYAAPEALSGVIGKEVDYWSFGIILMELLTGKHPFENISHGLINLYLTSKPMPIPENVEEGWKCLFKGLLTRDFKGRWGYEQITSWLNGKYRDIPLYYESETITVEGTTPETFDIRAYHFNDKDIYSVKALTEELIKDPDSAVKHLLRGYIGKWVENQIQDYQLKSEIDDILEATKTSDARKLSMFIYKANPELPLTYKDRVFTDHNMALWLRNIIAGNETELDKEIINELEGGLYADFLLETKRMAPQEVVRFKQTLTYGLENICKKAPFPLIYSAYLFLLLVNDDTRREALDNLYERICATTSKVLDEIYQESAQMEESDKWIESLKEPYMLIVVLLKYGEERAKRIVAKLGDSTTYSGIGFLTDSSDSKRLGLQIGFLESFLDATDHLNNQKILEIIGDKIESIKAYCSDILSKYVVAERTTYGRIMRFIKHGSSKLHIDGTVDAAKGDTIEVMVKRCDDDNGVVQLSKEKASKTKVLADRKKVYHETKQLLEDFKTGVEISWLFKNALPKRLTGPGQVIIRRGNRLIHRNSLKDKLEETIGKLKEILQADVIEALANKKYLAPIASYIDKYVSREVEELGSKDLDWLEKGNRLIKMHRPEEFIDKAKLEKDISFNKSALEALVSDNIPLDEDAEELFGRVENLLETKQVELNDTGFQWNKRAKKLLSKTKRCIEKKALAGHIKANYSILRSLITEKIPNDSETEVAFSEAKTLLDKYVDKEHSCLNSSGKDKSILIHYRVDKEHSCLNSQDLRWNEQAASIHSRAKNFVAKATLWHHISEIESKLRSTLDKNIARSHEAEEAFSEARHLLTSFRRKQPENLGLDDLQWKNKAYGAFARTKNSIPKNVLLDEIRKKAYFLKEFSQNRRPKPGSEHLSGLISQSKKLTRKFLTYSLEDLGDKSFSHFMDLYQCETKIRNSNASFYTVSRGDLLKKRFKFFLIICVSLTAMIFVVKWIYMQLEEGERPPKLVDVTFKLESGTTYPITSRKVIKLHRPGYYLFNHVRGYSPTTYPLLINFGDFSTTSDKLDVFDKYLFIEKPCTITFRYKSAYKRNLTSKIQIKEITGTPKEISHVVFPDKYAQFSFKVIKGQRLNIRRQNELYYIGYFKNGSLIKETLVKNKDRHLVWFWDKYVIKFKAAEVPFVMTMSSKPYIEMLELSTPLGSSKPFGSYFLKKGEAITTPLWLDKADKVSMDDFYIDKVALSIDDKNSPWKKPMYYIGRGYYYASHSGYLKIKAQKSTVVNRISVERKQKWKFKLKKGQVKRINVYSGDILESSSRSRYYVDGELLDGDRKHRHTTRKDGYVEFQGSLISDDIYVKVLSRRGH